MFLSVCMMCTVYCIAGGTAAAATAAEEVLSSQKKAVELHSASEVKYNCSAHSFTSSTQSSNSQQNEVSSSTGEGYDEIG